MSKYEQLLKNDGKPCFRLVMNYSEDAFFTDIQFSDHVGKLPDKECAEEIKQTLASIAACNLAEALGLTPAEFSVRIQVAALGRKKRIK